MRTSSTKGIFVVQLHAARKRHFDFRIELSGRLVSWAVPKGPTVEPGMKRLAIHVEDHPLEYASFEGMIPDGNYGAGAVIVWDTGTWIPTGDAASDPQAAFDRGVLHLHLAGYKLRGEWMLVRTGKNKSGKQWMLFKKNDPHAHSPGMVGDQSVLSGLTVEELASGHEREAPIREQIERLGAPRRAIDARTMPLMLCHVAEQPFSDPNWLYELKYDGYRLIAERNGPHTYLRYRSGRDATRLFPEIARTVAALPYDGFLLDGEVAVFGDDGRPIFNRLQQRTQLSRDADIWRAAIQHPVRFMVFDLLSFSGYDLRDLPLMVRKHLLQQILPSLGALGFTDHILERGEAFYAAVLEQGLEGAVAKRADSAYVGKRSDMWLKMRVERIDDFAIVGYTSPKGNRTGFGSLHVAVCERDTWTYAGRVGTGFDHLFLAQFATVLAREPRWEPTFEPPSSPQRKDHWIEPRMVCEVKYLDWSSGSHLRFPRFLRLRDDKRPTECIHPTRTGDSRVPTMTASPVQSSPPALPTSSSSGASLDPQIASTTVSTPGDEVDENRPVGRDLKLSNRNKVYFPKTNVHHEYTKGDLLDYYREIGPWILPYLRNRPVALTRYPDGIHGNSFFQKDMPPWMPGWIRTESLWSKQAQRELRYVVCDDVDTVVFLANMGTIPLHVWSARMATLSRPDWCVLDLDPKGASFEHVIRIARSLRTLCGQLELDCAIKTSGQDGLHIMIPMGAAYTYEQSRTLAEVLAKVVANEHADIATTARRIEHRRGRVYIDYVQNAHARLIAAPLSVRPRPGAPVSMPLRWREVNTKLNPARYTIANAVRRMSRLADDPFASVLQAGCDLPRALALLGERLAASQ